MLMGKYRDAFDNMKVAIELLITTGSSIAGCERSFSKLKLIKTYLRSTMRQERLTNLALLSIEHHELERADFPKLVSNFAVEKARKMLL